MVHEKIKDHAQKVGSHVKKHHKKYLWWFFAGFAIAKTIKVIIAAVWILVSLNHVPGTIAADSYDWCVFEEQFCIDWARKNTRNEKQVNLCIASWVEIVWYINKSTNDKVVSAFLQNLWRKWTSQEFAEPYNVYEKKGAICSCCNGEEWQKSCCDAKEQNCTL